MEVRKRFGFLFQMGALFDSSNVLDNVAFPLTEHTRKSREEVQEIARQKLALVGLPDIGAKMPAELSGGQKKRVALARAIALDPEVILYDEPTTGLDPVRADVINELIVKLQKELKVTSIVVTHDMQSAFKVADRIVMLHEGHLIFDGTPQEIQKTDNEVVKRFVLGEASEQELAQLGAGAYRERHGQHDLGRVRGGRRFVPQGRALKNLTWIPTSHPPARPCLAATGKSQHNAFHPEACIEFAARVLSAG